MSGVQIGSAAHGSYLIQCCGARLMSTADEDFFWMRSLKKNVSSVGECRRYVDWIGGAWYKSSFQSAMILCQLGIQHTLTY